MIKTADQENERTRLGNFDHEPKTEMCEEQPFSSVFGLMSYEEQEGKAWLNERLVTHAYLNRQMGTPYFTRL